MKLHPGKAPLFLVAGKDDMHICELSLEKTGLTRKKGTEILPQEFEQGAEDPKLFSIVISSTTTKNNVRSTAQIQSCHHHDTKDYRYLYQILVFMAEAGSKSLVIAGCDLGTTMSQSASAMSAKIARLNAKERIISAEIQLAKAEIQLAELQIEKARVIAARSKSRSAHSPESSLHSSKIYPAKRDVSGWTYQQMRVAINSSTDIILLEACKEEFHRRLKVYNNWKMRNAARTGANQQRATKQLLQEAPVTRAHAAASNSGLVDRVQRYFRLPYSQPGDQSGDLSPMKRGWWCAHFDGDYIARQMELLPDKAPVILVAGKDDMHICGLSVEETGLSRKKGVEILPQEFEQLWLENGGREYLLKAISSGRARSTYATAMMNTQPDPVNGQWL